MKNTTDDLAKQRTALASKRTIIAAERTLMAWIRTGLAMISFGFSIYKFFQILKPQEKGMYVDFLTEPRSLALALTGLGVGSLVLAIAQHWAFVTRFREEYQGSIPRFSLAVVTAMTVAFIGLAALFAILGT